MSAADREENSGMIAAPDFKWTDQCAAQENIAGGELTRPKSASFRIKSEVSMLLYKCIA